MSITTVLWLLSVALAATVLMAATRWRRFGRLGNEAAAALLLASLPFAVTAFAHIVFIVLAISVNVWLLVLPARALVGRLEPQFLAGSTRRNALLGLLLAVLVVVLQWAQPVLFTETALMVWLAASASVALFFLGQLFWSMRHYRLPKKEGNEPAQELPTVSVCIPARNETHALTDCLQSVLTSDYPKLEVLVLDDCSQDNTPSVIRSFAHDGARFIQGDTPAAGWLGKNQAMQTLAQHASGDLLLFIGVDTHLAPHSITAIVEYSRAHKLEMVSVLPQNRLGLHIATLFNTLEYYWRLVLPVTRRRMPVSSKAWMVSAQSLRSLGGFAAVSRKIVPEESFARRLATRKAYRFLVSNKALGMTTAKRWSSQVETSLRLAYPRMHREPLAAYLLVLALLVLLVAPFIATAVLAFTGEFGILFWLGASAALLFLLTYYTVLLHVQPRSWLLTGLLWPLAALQEAVIFSASMLLYEFGEVNWKGRNVCYPVVSPRPQPDSRSSSRQSLPQ